jgi:hypothetical protein
MHPAWVEGLLLLTGTLIGYRSGMIHLFYGIIRRP